MKNYTLEQVPGWPPMERFETSYMLLDLEFNSLYDHDTIWALREYLEHLGIPTEPLSSMATQDRIMALMAAILKRHDQPMGGRSLENLKKILEILVRLLEENEVLAIFDQVPFEELTTIADIPIDPADYWKEA
jgi:hypothetical protein